MIRWQVRLNQQQPVGARGAKTTSTHVNPSVESPQKACQEECFALLWVRMYISSFDFISSFFHNFYMNREDLYFLMMLVIMAVIVIKRKWGGSVSPPSLPVHSRMLYRYYHFLRMPRHEEGWEVQLWVLSRGSNSHPRG